MRVSRSRQPTTKGDQKGLARKLEGGTSARRARKTPCSISNVVFSQPQAFIPSPAVVFRRVPTSTSVVLPQQKIGAASSAEGRGRSGVLSQNQGRANEREKKPCSASLWAPGLRWECNATDDDGSLHVSTFFPALGGFGL